MGLRDRISRHSEVDSLDGTDGSFSHAEEKIRSGLDGPPMEIDSFHHHERGRIPGVNRFGEKNPRPVLGREGEAPGTEHFEHDPNYSWSTDNRSESASEKGKSFPQERI